MAKLPLGLVIKLEEGIDIAFKKVHDLNLPTCQVSTYDPRYFSKDVAEKISELCTNYKIQVTTLWAGWPGRVVWDFIDGPDTIGLVPLPIRKERCKIMHDAADFASKLNLKSLTTHIGFVPESPSDPIYPGLVVDIREIADYCEDIGVNFCMETGQETPVTLLRLIEDVGSRNIGINFDPANLIMYGKANPVDALGILHPYIQGVHVKDGCYPINGRELGEEKPLGEGQVNIQLFLSSLIGYGYGGPLTIERETTGPEQMEDILSAIRYIDKIVSIL
jgi:L-ribulose-5-phosphate 3-epimerase